MWNVHRKNGTKRPASEWIIVENAHPAIITEGEAIRIAEVRKVSGKKRAFDTGFSKSRKSDYLLSGGLFKCNRCGSNMVGLKKSNDKVYYIFGSQPYRKGKGCGPGVYVRQDMIESEVIEGLNELVGAWEGAGNPG